MVQGIEKLNWYTAPTFTVGGNEYTKKVEKQPYQQGVNYAQFDPKPQNIQASLDAKYPTFSPESRKPGVGENTYYLA